MANIQAMEKQGAPPKDIQAYLDSFKGQRPPATNQSAADVFAAQTSQPEVLNDGTQVADTIGGRIKQTAGAVADIGIGAAKGVMGAPQRAAELGNKIGSYLSQTKAGQAFGGAIKGILPQAAAQKAQTALQKGTEPTALGTPTNQAQKLGYGIEQAAEFLAPAGAISKAGAATEKGLLAAQKAKKISSLGAKVVGTAVKSGLEATAAGGISALQGAKAEDVKRNAILAGAIPFAGALAKAAAKPLGQKMEMALIKPTIADVKDGFKIENIGKYGLEGPLEDSSLKAHNEITKRVKQINEMAEAQTAKIDLNQAIDEVAAEMGKDKAKQFGFQTKIQKAIDFFKEEAATLSPDGQLSIGDAQEAKRSVGKMGAWQFGKRDPESTALENVANKLYTKLRLKIEAASPAQLSALNKELQELIPIENAIIRRIPVAQRANAIGLTDVITGVGASLNPSTWWLFALNKMARSPRVAGILTRAGKAQQALPKGVIEKTGELLSR